MEWENGGFYDIRLCNKLIFEEIRAYKGKSHCRDKKKHFETAMKVYKI